MMANWMVDMDIVLLHRLFQSLESGKSVEQLTLNQRVAGSQRNAMKLTLKDLVKLIAPYLVAIGGAIGV